MYGLKAVPFKRVSSHAHSLAPATTRFAQLHIRAQQRKLKEGASLNEGHGFSRAITRLCLTASAAEVRFSKLPRSPRFPGAQIPSSPEVPHFTRRNQPRRACPEPVERGRDNL